MHMRVGHLYAIAADGVDDVATCGEPGTAEGLINAFVLGAIWPALATIYNRFTGNGLVDAGPLRRRRNLPVNELGHTLAIALAMACYLAATTQRAVWFWFYAALMGVFQLGVLLTGSRGATITSVVAWLLLPLIFHRLKAYKKTAAVVFGVALVLAVLAVVPAASWNRLGTTDDRNRIGQLLAARPYLGHSGWNVFQKHPIAGVGAGAFPSRASPSSS